MANALRGRIEITIGGQPTQMMRLPMKSLRKIEKTLGRSLQALMANNDFGIDAVSETIAIGLTRKSKRVTADEVSDWIDQEPQRFGEFQLLAIKCIILAMGGDASLLDDDDGEDEEDTGPLGSAADAAPLAAAPPESGPDTHG